MDVPITHYTVEYLYRDTENNFIRGVHAIKSVALYLPSVFLENVYDNGTWIQRGDREWPQEHQFDLTETLGQLEVKGGQKDAIMIYIRQKLFTIICLTRYLLRLLKGGYRTKRKLNKRKRIRSKKLKRR